MKQKSGLRKRLFATVLSAVMALTSVPVIGTQTAEAANLMPDVSETHWARNSIEKMVNQNILSGDSEGNMNPDRPVTRAEYIAMINRAFGYDEVFSGVSLPFKDVEGKEWYADHLRIAYEQGYFSGVDKSTAGATRPVTRQEAAAMICRNLKLSSTTPQIQEFSDGNEISQWSKSSVGAAVEKGFIHGYTDGSFRPKALISRAEAATMFSNAMGTIYDRGGVYGQGMVEGNVTIASSGVVLENMVITGDLYLTEGVGTGYVTLDNVTVLGEVIVCGGGEGNFGGNSVTLDDCTIWKLTVDGSEERPVSLYAKGTTNIPETNIKSITYLQNHPDIEVGFNNIEVKGPAETKLYLSGTFENVAAMHPKNQIILGKGKVKNMTVDEDATDAMLTLDRNVVVENMNLDGNGQVSGRGDIESLIVTTEGTTVQSLPDQIEIRPGVTSSIAGKQMTSLDADESSSAPKIVAGYPRAEEITSAAAKVYFQTNKPGSIRWALIYDDAEELDEDEILKPTTITRIKKYGSLNIPESEKEASISLSGLESNATYILCAVLVDERGDVSRIKEEEIETADKTVPGFVSGYPKTVPKTSNSFEIQAMLTKDANIYWAVYKKGAAAPTAYQLRSQNLDGTICHGVKKKALKNIEYGAPDLTVLNSKLTEKETYDVYVMASDGERDSKIVKLSATTKDTTPPEYNPDPRPDKNDATSVSITLGANEDVTAYYVVIPWGDTFPVPVPEDKGNYPNPPKLDSEFARRQVLNGNNVFKSGKASVKANTDTTVKISGLGKETPYHVYIVLQDKAGNYSTWVKKVDVKTKDVTPPKVGVEFENTIGGKADVEEDIMLVFNEIVCYTAPGTLLKGQEGLSAADHLKALQQAEVFKLLDVSSTKEKEVEINYAPVKIDGKEILPIEFAEGENGATIVIFHPEAFPQYNDDDHEDKVTGYGLHSGVSYKFILNHILDTTGNAMKKDYETEIFQTAPPLIELEQTNEPGNPKYKDVDYAFRMTPEVQQTAPEILFDIVFTSDRNIDFELLIWDEALGKFVQINNAETDTLVSAGSYVTLHGMIDPLKELDFQGKPIGEITFEKFNQLEPREYAVRITRIDTQPEADRLGWDAIVKMEVKCVAAPITQMENIQEKKYEEAMSSGKASMVNYSTQNIKDPSEFIMEMSFSDTITPKFRDGYPQLNHLLTGPDTEVGDVFIRPQLWTDRRAMMYYVIVPAGTVGGFDWDTAPVYKKDGQELDYNTYTKGVPNRTGERSIDKILTYAIISNTLKADIWGTYQIESDAMRYQVQLPVGKDLQPNKWYEMYCVLKGTPETPSQVYYVPFKTKDIDPPKLEATVTAKRATSADILITSDKYAYIDWIIVPYANIKDFLVKDASGQVLTPYKIDSKHRDRMIEFIQNGTKEPTLNHLEFRGGMAEANDPKAENPVYQLLVSTTRPLEPKTSYVLMGVGQMHLSNNGGEVGGYSEIVVSQTFEQKDTAPPEIEDPLQEGRLETVIDLTAADVNMIGKPYSGNVTIYFTEPLFYKANDHANPEPITAENFEEYFMDSLPDDYFQTDPLKLYFEETTVLDNDKKPIKAVDGCKLKFKDVIDGVRVRLSSNLCDMEGNMMQRYYLIFHGTENEPQPNEPDSVVSGEDDATIAARRKFAYWTYIGMGTENEED